MGILWKLLKYGQPMLVYPSGFLDEEDVVDTPDMYQLPYRDVTLTTKDRVQLHCYLIQHNESTQTSRGTVLMFHGNAMNHGAILGEACSLFNAGFNVFTLEYRGYGRNKGRPSEKGLRLDAQAAMDYLSTDPTLKKDPIIVFGQSLGGAVAIDVTSRNPSKVSALIVENTFTSIPNIVREIPVLRHIVFLCTQQWNSQAKMRGLPPSLPILLLSGQQDTVVPPKHMEVLFSEAQGRCYRAPVSGIEKGRLLRESSGTTDELSLIVKFPSGTHNSTCCQRGYQHAVQSFLDKHAPQPSKSD